MRHRCLSIISLALLVAFAVSIAAARADYVGGWPETCLEMNDMVEASDRAGGAVGIYQRAFGDDAEAACQNDHRDDIQRAFAWAFSDVPAPAATSTPAPPMAASVGNGTFIVGIDIDAGTYRSAGPSNPDVPFCSYARLRDAGGGILNVDNVLDIQNVQGPGVVTIQTSDGGFFSQGCQPWEKVTA